MVRFRLAGDFESRDAETALLWQAGCTAIEEEGGDLLAYFPSQTELALAGSWEAVPDHDWLARYYADLKPVVLSRLVIAPSHCTVPDESGRLILRLDPGMAFGTGHHVTTRLALEALSRLDLSGKVVLDVGAGSGILAIAADLLGAATAQGCDTDPLTVPIARKNAVCNGSQARFAVGTLDETTPPASVDVLVANLTAELHRELAPRYRRVLRPGGDLILSGILVERLPMVIAALGPTAALTTEHEDGWALLYARLPR